MMHDMAGMEMGTGMMFFMMAFWFTLLALIVVAIVYMFKQMGGEVKSPSKVEESALEILQKRYARGEIDKKEFDDMKNTLL